MYCRRTKRWEAHIWDDKKQVYLGGFDIEEHAGTTIVCPQLLPPSLIDHHLPMLSAGIQSPFSITWMWL